jgi:hypothetical protein
MKRQSLCLVGAACVALASVAWAQKPIVYPAKNQSAQQQRKDDGECMAWAKSNTGIDPAAASQPASQQTGPAGAMLLPAGTSGARATPRRTAT